MKQFNNIQMSERGTMPLHIELSSTHQVLLLMFLTIKDNILH